MGATVARAVPLQCREKGQCAGPVPIGDCGRWLVEAGTEACAHGHTAASARALGVAVAASAGSLLAASRRTTPTQPTEPAFDSVPRSFRFPALLALRTVWLPTAWGWLLLLAAGVGAAAALAHGAYTFLAVQRPLVRADTLVVEGWLSDRELDQAIAAFRRGHYRRVVTTGGPLDWWGERPPWKTFADRAADYLQRHGLAGVTIVPVPAPRSAQERTFLSAVMVRDWARAAGADLRAFDLYSAGTHARRSRKLYRMAFGPGVDIGVMAAIPEHLDPSRWWATSAGAKSVLGEAVSLAWTTCCFWPGPAGSHEERWAVPRR